MKKIISILLALVCSTMCFAQSENDVIITLDNTQIPCLIAEISDSIVKYQRLDRPAAIQYTMNTNKIAKIVYRDGTVDNYETPTIVTQQLEESATAISQLQSQSQPITTTSTKADETTSVVIVKKAEKAPLSEAHYITRSGNDYIYNGQYMKGRVFNHSLYADFLKNNCTPAYAKFNTGSIVAAWGWGFFIGGLIVDLGFSWWLPYSGYVALPFEIASIPMLIVGYCQMHKSAEIFNMQCSRNQSCYWSINSSKDGIGLAFNF